MPNLCAKLPPFPAKSGRPRDKYRSDFRKRRTGSLSVISNGDGGMRRAKPVGQLKRETTATVETAAWKTHRASVIRGSLPVTLGGSG